MVKDYTIDRETDRLIEHSQTEVIVFTIWMPKLEAINKLPLPLFRVRLECAAASKEK